MRASRSWRVLTAVLAGTVALLSSPALAASSNASATLAYLRADHALIKAFANVPAEESSAASLAREVNAECPHILAGAPHSGGYDEIASEASVGLLDALARPFFSAAITFARRVEHLRWSSLSLTRLVHLRAADDRAELSVPPPHLCADYKAWVASDYQTVPHGTTAFLASYAAASERPGASREEIARKFARYEGPQMKALARSTKHLEADSAPLRRKAFSTAGTHLSEALGLSTSEL